MERDIRRSNMVPGSCEEFTRPEEISALSKYLKQVKEEYDSNLTVNEDNLEVHGRKFIGDQEKLPDLMEVLSPRDDKVSSLVSSKEWLDNDKSLKGLEQKRHDLKGTKGDVKLGIKPEGLKGASGETSNIGGTKERIGGDRKEPSHLEEEKIGKLNKLLGGSREEILEGLVERLFNEKTTNLGETVEPIKGNVKSPGELRNNKSTQGLGGIEEIKTLENALSTLETEDKPINLRTRKERLEESSKEENNLKSTSDKLPGLNSNPNRLDENTEKLRGQGDEIEYLGKDKESLRDDKLPITELKKSKEKLKDWRENRVEKGKLEIPGYSKTIRELEEHQEAVGPTEKDEIKALRDKTNALPGMNPKVSDLRPEKERVKGQKEPLEVLRKTSETLKTNTNVESLEETLLKVSGKDEVESLKPAIESLSLPKNGVSLEEDKEKLRSQKEIKSLSDKKEEIRDDKTIKSLEDDLERIYGNHEEPEELRHLVEERIALGHSRVIEELPDRKVDISNESSDLKELNPVREDLKLPRQDNPLELEKRKERVIEETKEVKDLRSHIEVVKDRKKDPEFPDNTIILRGVEDERDLSEVKEVLRVTDNDEIDSLSTKADKLETQGKVDSLYSKVTEKIRINDEEEQVLSKGSISLEVEGKEVRDLSKGNLKLEGIKDNDALPDKRDILDVKSPTLEELPTDTISPSNTKTEEITVGNHKENLTVNQEDLRLETKREELEGTKEEIKLESLKETLGDTKGPEELSNVRKNLSDNRELEALENHKETKPGNSEDITTLPRGQEKIKVQESPKDLEEKRIGLEETPKSPTELESHKETLEDSRENKLENHREALDDPRENNLEDYRDRLEDSRENELENYKDKLKDPRENELEDHKERLEDSRENNLEDYRETLEDQRENNLEDYKETIDDSRENALEDFISSLQDSREDKLGDHKETLGDTDGPEELYDDKTVLRMGGTDPEEKLHTKEDSIQAIGDSLDETLGNIIEELTVTDKVGSELRGDYVEETRIGYEDTNTLHDNTTISKVEGNENVENLYDAKIQLPGENRDEALHTSEETLDKLTIEEFEKLTDIVINGTWEDNVDKLYDEETLVGKEEDNLTKLGKASVNSIIGAFKAQGGKGSVTTIEALLKNLYQELLASGYIQEGNLIKDDETKINQDGTRKAWNSLDGLHTEDQTKTWVDEDNLDKMGKESLGKTIKDGDDPALLAFAGEKTLGLTKDNNSVKVLGGAHELENLEDYLGTLGSGDHRKVEKLEGKDTLLNIEEDNLAKIGNESVNSIIESGGIGKMEALLSALYQKLLSKGLIQGGNLIKDDTSKNNQDGTKKTWSEDDGLYDAVLAMDEDSRTSDLISDVEDYRIDSEGNDPESMVVDGHVTTFNPESEKLGETNLEISEDENTTTFNPGEDSLSEEIEEKLLGNTNEDSEVESLREEINEILKTRGDLGLYYNNILKFADSKQLNKGWSQKVKGLMSTYLGGTGNISQGRAEQFERALYKTIIDEDYKNLDKLKTEPGPEELKEKLGKEDMVASYKLPSFNLMGNGCDPTSYLRWVAENTVGKAVHGPARAILMDETLGLLVLARDSGEKLLKINRDRLPGSDITSQLLGGGLSLGSVAKSAVKAGAKALFGGGGVDMTLPNNRPDNKKERTEWDELLSDKTQDPSKKKLKSINFQDSYLKGAGFNTTLKDLIGQAKAPDSVEKLYSMLRSSPYITNAGKVTSYDYNPLRVQTLDTNQYWEIIFRPFTGVENNWKSYLPAINEINTWNEVYHNVKTAYSSWIPITSFELSKAKLSTKTLGLFDGEISYPVSMEFTNEFRMTIADDQYKSWRTYFERCVDTMVYNSEVHDHSWYADDYDDSWGAMDLSDRAAAEQAKVDMTKAKAFSIDGSWDLKTIRIGRTKKESSEGKLTAVDKRYHLVAPYKNVTFRCTIYSMTPQFSTISKYDLLLVLKDFVEERSGDIDGDPGDLSVNFSIVGECPKEELQAVNLKGSPQDFMKKKTEDVKRKGSNAASIVSSGVNKVIGVL